MPVGCVMRRVLRAVKSTAALEPQIPSGVSTMMADAWRAVRDLEIYLYTRRSAVKAVERVEPLPDTLPMVSSLQARGLRRRFRP